MGQITTWDEFPTIEYVPGVFRQTVSGEKTMLTRIVYRGGVVIPDHYHPAEQLMLVEQGRLWAKVGDEEAEVGPGSLLVIPSDCVHAFRQLSDEDVVFYEASRRSASSTSIGFKGPDASLVMIRKGLDEAREGRRRVDADRVESVFSIIDQTPGRDRSRVRRRPHRSRPPLARSTMGQLDIFSLRAGSPSSRAAAAASDRRWPRRSPAPGPGWPSRAGRRRPARPRSSASGRPGSEGLAITADVTERGRLRSDGRGDARAVRPDRHPRQRRRRRRRQGAPPGRGYPRADWDWIMELNVRSTLLPTQAVARAMIEAGDGGAVLNISSVRANLGINAGYSAYVAAKGAISSLTRQWATEWAKHGIRVNAIMPTFVDTPQVAMLLEDPAFKAGIVEPDPARPRRRDRATSSARRSSSVPTPPRS